MEKLIALAESLNVARNDANAIEETAPQSDAYGDIVDALMKVLAHIVGFHESKEVYESLLNGNSVRQSLTIGYDVRLIRGGCWKVTRPSNGETVGRIYLSGIGKYSPERAIDRVLAGQHSLDAAVFELVTDYRANR